MCRRELISLLGDGAAARSRIRADFRGGSSKFARQRSGNLLLVDPVHHGRTGTPQNLNPKIRRK